MYSFGLCTAPYLFRKILKPVLRHLRSTGFLSINYLDDFLLLGHTKDACSKNMKRTISLLKSLGFIIYYNKSHLNPSRRCRFLGFLFNSHNLTITVPHDKKERINRMLSSFFKIKNCIIQTFPTWYPSVQLYDTVGYILNA